MSILTEVSHQVRLRLQRTFGDGQPNSMSHSQLPNARSSSGEEPAQAPRPGGLQQVNAARNFRLLEHLQRLMTDSASTRHGRLVRGGCAEPTLERALLPASGNAV